jgi:hypothetical protein
MMGLASLLAAASTTHLSKAALAIPAAACFVPMREDKPRREDDGGNSRRPERGMLHIARLRPARDFLQQPANPHAHDFGCSLTGNSANSAAVQNRSH